MWMNEIENGNYPTIFNNGSPSEILIKSIHILRHKQTDGRHDRCTTYNELIFILKGVRMNIKSVIKKGDT